MATNQDSRQMSIEILSVNDIPQLHPQLKNARRDFSSTETVSDGTDSSGENTPLFRNNKSQQPSCFSKVKSKFKSRRCCLCSSKAALIILVWNMIVSFGLLVFTNPSYYETLLGGDPIMMCIIYATTTFLLLFYPLAGCLADIRWGRHKTVVNSLYFTFWSSVLIITLGGLGTICFIPIMVLTPYQLNTIQITTIVVVCTLFGLPSFFGAILLLCSLVAFSANVIQYGMDQLHDAPADDSVVYIHWYVWTIFLVMLVVRSSTLWTFIFLSGPILYFSVIPLALLLLGITLCVYRCKRNFFLVESGSRNPYKLVYKVSKFAKEHSNPIRRSAFTYCEDELPSRFDLGKEKYGGPFTTEEVENVKAFFGILCVLLTTGPTLMAEIANDLSASQLYSGFAAPLIIVVSIPLYLGLLRPFIHNYIPGMLKRMGLGMILLLLSCLCSFAMSFFQSNNCSTEYYDNSTYIDCDSAFPYDQPKYSLYYISIQNIFNAVGYMLFYIASYEFICAQSPHSMKGLLIGTFFAIKGVFQLLGVLVIYAPIVFLSETHRFGNGGFTYYLINVVIALIGLIAFTITARRYQYRQRDEPDNIYRYAEEYYANAQDEPNYDYDDYDNLNCETINK